MMYKHATLEHQHQTDFPYSIKMLSQDGILIKNGEEGTLLNLHAKYRQPKVMCLWAECMFGQLSAQTHHARARDTGKINQGTAQTATAPTRGGPNFVATNHDRQRRLAALHNDLVLY